ncbi:hypothetical protein L1987_05627 [Smallanthus sonchifolius]|uniref:Uncharacterized protein n=1 Tax=Smallanthus sonchifolius TaxID=185202 RepID=A0ACB9JW22_9ASTR|nr:hypothetical protein L1987_05627 [Smallanthus sonchifolius]
MYNAHLLIGPSSTWQTTIANPGYQSKVGGFNGTDGSETDACGSNTGKEIRYTEKEEALHAQSVAVVVVLKPRSMVAATKDGCFRGSWLGFRRGRLWRWRRTRVQWCKQLQTTASVVRFGGS